MDISLLDCDTISNVFEFLHFKDAIKLCLVNKLCYTKFLIFCYKFSFVPLDLTKKGIRYYQRIKDFSATDVASFDLFQIFCHQDMKIPTINVAEQIRYANCINNISSLEKIAQFVPKKLKHISLSKKFNAVWDRKFLPNTVETISFHEKSKFNYNISCANLPTNLRKISFGYLFDQSIDDLPDSVEIIVFCHNSRFNKFIKKYPANLKEIYFGDYYDKPIISPPSLKLIYFSNNSNFDSSIEYPPDLEKIYFGRCYNKSLDDLDNLPKLSIIKFHYSSKFNLPITCRSNTLKAIYLGIEFNNTLDLRDCNSLTTLKFYHKSKFDNDQIYTPPSLEFIYMGKNFNSDLILPTTIKLVKFPTNSKFVSNIDFFGITSGVADNTELIMGKKYNEIYTKKC